MNKEEILQKIREERPDQIIHEVIDFKENSYGYFDVSVDMQIILMNTKIKHYRITIPYPLEKYNELKKYYFYD